MCMMARGIRSMLNSHHIYRLNTDGVALYNSSKVSIWPVWAVVNELPSSLWSVLIFVLVQFLSGMCL